MVKRVVVLSRAQKLAKALKVCRRDRVKGRRVVCERTARKRYGVVKRKAVKRSVVSKGSVVLGRGR